MRKRQIFCSVIVSICLMHQGHALAPVVDDSDNFAIFDDEGVKTSPPSSHAKQHVTNNDEPIAKVMPEDRTEDSSLSGQVRAMQQELQALRGEIEVQAHNLETLKQQQMSFYKDLDARVQQLSSSKPGNAKTASIDSPPVATVSPTTSPSSMDEKLPIGTPAPVNASAAIKMNNANPADEQVAYLAAYDLVKAKRYDNALSAMQAFVSQYPNGGYTANAEYWIGELYLAKNNPTDALKHFEIVLSRFSTSSKAAASALKIGYALSALGKNEEAKQRLHDVIKNYPDTAAAQLAKSKIDSM